MKVDLALCLQALSFRFPKKSCYRVFTWDLGGEEDMKVWMLILGIAIASVFGGLASTISNNGTTIAAAQETEPAPTPTPAPEE